MVEGNVPEVKNPMRIVALRMMGDGGLLQETAPLHSVELSVGTAQAKEGNLCWSITVKVYDADLTVAGAKAYQELSRQWELAKVEPV